jgi:hypothetical protein
MIPSQAVVSYLDFVKEMAKAECIFWRTLTPLTQSVIHGTNTDVFLNSLLSPLRLITPDNRVIAPMSKNIANRQDTSLSPSPQRNRLNGKNSCEIAAAS